MRIPTVVVVNDYNPELVKLSEELSKLVRVYKRTSLQGEQLYNIREGVIYFDDKGDRQFIHQDVYSDTIKQLKTKLDTISPLSKTLLAKHLNPEKNEQ